MSIQVKIKVKVGSETQTTEAVLGDKAEPVGKITGDTVKIPTSKEI